METGVDLTRVLSNLQTQFSRTALGPVLGRLQVAVRRGDSLSDAMSREPRAFDTEFLSMIRVAEARGAMPETLRRMADHYDARQRLIRQARSALIYPTAVILIAGLVGGLLTIFVLPKLVAILEDMVRGRDVTLPLPTRLLIGLSNFIQTFGWWMIPLGVIGIAFFGFWLYRTPPGKALMDELALSFPVLGKLLRKIETSRFARTLSSLLEAGVDFGASMDLTADVVRLVPFRKAVQQARQTVLEGGELSTALAASRRFTPDVVAIVETGEETGQLPETLERLADDYEDQVEHMVRNLGVLIQPLLVIGAGRYRPVHCPGVRDGLCLRDHESLQGRSIASPSWMSRDTGKNEPCDDFCNHSSFSADCAPHSCSGTARAEGDGWKAGTARVAITPKSSMWMAGYGGRDHPSEGALHDLWAKILVLEDPNGHTAVVVTLDLCGIGQPLSNQIRDRIQERNGLQRDQIVLACSHTHTGPVVGKNLIGMYPLDDEQRQKVEQYADFLSDVVVRAVGQAFDRREPATLSWGTGRADFAVNRRNNDQSKAAELREQIQLKGPVDHDVPVLRVAKPDGTLRAVVFGYACHCTVLPIYKFTGDYAGFAQIALEKAHPEAQAMFVAGCGGDQNPLPRGTVAHAEQLWRATRRGRRTRPDRTIAADRWVVEYLVPGDPAGLRRDSVPGAMGSRGLLRQARGS